MKKLSIRSLLIVVLALVLVFSLVACGDKDKGGNNGGNNTPPTPPDTTANVKNYFNTLWEKSTGIGGEKIGETDDLKVSLGLTVALDFADGNGSVKDSIDLGILLDVVLDRSSGTDKSTNTAIKAKFYDPTSGENWFSAYYFFNDVDNLYIDYAGQHVQIPFSYLNDTYNKNFYNFVFNDKVIKDKVDDKGQVTKEGKTIAQIITALTQNMGSSWDLNVLIGDVLKVFDIDIESAKGTISGVLEAVGIKADDAFDAQGNINIKNILTNDTVAEFFVNDETTTTTENGVTTYVTKLSPSVIGMLELLKDKLPESLNGLFDVINGLDLALEFTTKNDAIDSFTIRAGLPAIEGENANAVDVHPVVAITITDLDFAKASKGEIEKSMATEKNNYKNDVVLDAEVAIDLKGITLDATKFDKYGYNRFSQVNAAMGNVLTNIKLDGTLALTLNGKLDLKDAENNKTEAAAALTYKAAGAESAVAIVKASFKGGNLALTVNQEAKVGDVKIVDALVRLFGDYAYTWIKDTFFKTDTTELDKFAAKFFSCKLTEELAKDPQERVITINESFKGAVWKNIDIVGGFQGLVKKALDKMFPPKTGAGTAVAKDPIITKVADTVVAALPLIKSTNGKLVVATNANKAFKNAYSSVGNTVQTIGKIWWERNAKPFTETIIEGDKDNWLGHISKALTVAGCEYNDIAAAPLVTDEELAAAKEKREDKGLVTDKELADAKAKEPNAGLVTDQELADAKALEANAGKTDDALKAELQAEKDAKLKARLQEEKDRAIRNELQKAKDEARSKAFLNEMFACTAEVTLDISEANGFELGVKADVNASAGVAVSVKLGAKAYDATQYTNLAPDVETDGWFVYTFAA